MSGWLDRITKTVEGGVNRAASEADKAVRVARVSSEISAKQAEMERQFTAIGRLAWEQHQAGTGLPDVFAAQFVLVEQLLHDVSTLEAQREAIKTGAATGRGAAAPQPAVVEEVHSSEESAT